MVGDAGRIVSLEHYGASADYQRLYTSSASPPRAVTAAAHDSVRDRHGTPRPGGHQQTASPAQGGTADRG
ncbi:hypothetical protein [Streptacidiphilus albus]|uniref:hypothetical protein n=1 Tax=Streptacidiphilus albus TaxID=105425 RepID=UPI00054B671C|nr:hypothetical protein [Streptacidiphilus albus]